jgi:hypothetical protein
LKTPRAEPGDEDDRLCRKDAVRFLVIGAWDPSESRIPMLFEQERQRTGELMKQGFVQQFLLRADGTGGFMIVSADSAAAAHEQLSTLPFMKNGIMRVELIELRD